MPSAALAGVPAALVVPAVLTCACGWPPQQLQLSPHVPGRRSLLVALHSLRSRCWPATPIATSIVYTRAGAHITSACHASRGSCAAGRLPPRPLPHVPARQLARVAHQAHHADQAGAVGGRHSGSPGLTVPRTYMPGRSCAAAGVAWASATELWQRAPRERPGWEGAHKRTRTPHDHRLHSYQALQRGWQRWRAPFRSGGIAVGVGLLRAYQGSNSLQFTRLASQGHGALETRQGRSMVCMRGVFSRGVICLWCCPCCGWVVTEVSGAEPRPLRFRCVIDQINTRHIV